MHLFQSFFKAVTAGVDLIHGLSEVKLNGADHHHGLSEAKPNCTVTVLPSDCHSKLPTIDSYHGE